METAAIESEKTVQVRTFDLAKARALVSGMKLDILSAKFLTARGLDTPSLAADYLYPRLSRLHSPFLLEDIIPAVERLRRAIDAKETVAVFTDSDIDGLTSLSILLSLLDGANVPTVVAYPCGEENYGLNLRAIEYFASSGATLLVTLDCGIRDIDEIALAKQKGMDVIVCDHHEQGAALPDALVVDQKRLNSRYPFRDLAGAGVALKLCHALLVSYLPMYGKRFCIISLEDAGLDLRVVCNGITEQSLSGPLDGSMIDLCLGCDSVYTWGVSPRDAARLTEAGCRNEPFDNLLVKSGLLPGKTSPADIRENLGITPSASISIGDCAEEAFFSMSFVTPKKISSYLTKWLPLAAVGTIADVMPLTGENRIIVSCGLRAFAECDLPSVKALNDAFEPVTAKTVGWSIAPLLNTPGRLGKTELAASFFLSRSDEDCVTVMKEISKLNEERKDFLKKKLSLFSGEIESGSHALTKNFVYIKTDELTDGFTGLVAGRIADAHGCPAVVVSTSGGKDLVKGSGRASGGSDFLSYVEPFAEKFERFGGHASAFGFSAAESAVDDLMQEIDRSMDGAVVARKAKIADLEIDDTGEISERALKILSLCEPFGAGNEPPLFYSRSVPVLRYESFGGNGRHGKFLCGGRSTAAIGWGLASEMKDYDIEDGASFLYSAEFDPYSKRVRFIIDELL